MFKIFNRKINLHNTNISNRKYHKYFQEYKFFSERTQHALKHIEWEIDCGRCVDINLYEALFVSFENAIINEKAYTLLKKIDKNQKIFKTDYDDKVLQYIEIDKRFKFTTLEIYDKFDKFKQSIE